MSVSEGLCPEPVQLINLSREEILKGLADAVARMQRLGICNLMIYYAGHGFRRSWGWSTRAVTAEGQAFPLESSVQHAIQQAGLRDCKVVYFIDACQDCLDHDDYFDSASSSVAEQQEDPILLKYVLCSVQRDNKAPDNGLFATVLAYCLKCRVLTVSFLLQKVRDLVSQLSYWRQEPSIEGLGVSNDIDLFGPGGREIQAPMTEEQGPQRLFKKTFFLSRYLARLASDELLNARRADLPAVAESQLFLDSSLDRHCENVERTFAMLREIADQFEARKDFINGWVELVLLEACPTNDLEYFLATLLELENLEPLPSWTRAAEPNNLPQSIRDCLAGQLTRLKPLECKVPQKIREIVVDRLRKTVKDDYDADRSEKTLLSEAVELVSDLMTWFTEHEMETDDVSKKWTYAFKAEQAEIRPLPDSKRGRIADIINGKSEVFKIPYRVYLTPGSLWIIIRSEEELPRLQISEFLKSFAEWNQHWKDIPSVWKAMQKLIRVSINAVPRGLLRLVYQVEKLLEPSKCLWLRGSYVQNLAAKAINQKKSCDVQLDPSQVLVFEDNIDADRHSWLLACNSSHLLFKGFACIVRQSQAPRKWKASLCDSEGLAPA